METRRDSCEEIDFSDHWAKLHEAIYTGERLRVEKPRPSPEQIDEINIDFIKKPKKFKKHRKPCTKQCYQSDYTKPLSMQNFLHRNLCSKISSTIQDKIKTRKPKLKNKSNKCPLRIMELAEPTKRQCLETLKQKSHSLPDFMLNRLRQQLTDQKPVIKIGEALTCFKEPKKKKIKKKSQHEKRTKNMTDVKYFCGIFGANISKRLNKAKTTENLSNELQKLSKIVSEDIRRITSGRKNLKLTIDRNYNKNLQDVSRKVAIWVALILEDSAEKMLEEELRELDEEEGPVLDWLDDLFESAMDICEPYPQDKISSTSSDDFDDAVDKDSVGNEVEQKTNEEDIINDQLVDEIIDKIIKGITEYNEMTVEEAENDSDENKTGNEEDLSVKYNNRELNDVQTDKINLNENPSNDIIPTATVTTTDNLNDMNELDENADAPQTNRSDNETSTHNDEHKQFFNLDPMQISSDHDRNSNIGDTERSVKFSSNNDAEQPSYSSKSREDILNAHKEMVRRYITNNQNTLSWNQSSDYVVPLNVHPPNEHLLSQADEVWPRHIPPFEKVNGLDVVNKSVTSLGNISELVLGRVRGSDSLTSENERLIGQVQLRE